MININNITMGFSQRTLFSDVNLSIFPREKIGLAGANGSGKTTLFSIILGNMEPVTGSVTKQKNINIGFLPQEAKFSSSRTVMDEITSGDERIRGLIEEKHKLEDEGKAVSHRYGDILQELETLGIYDLEHRAEKILAGLGFKEEDFHKPISQLSGGWQMRTLLAKLLVYPYDLLLLDEPTNYLDLEATLWLKDFLSTYSGSFVLISHDRVFLNDVTNYTIMLEGKQMFKVKGNYETYESQKGIEQKTLERRQKVVEKKRKQLEDFANRFHAQPNRASAVKNKRKMIEKLENIELAQDRKSIGSFDFSVVKPSGYSVSRLDKVSKSYGDKEIYNNLDFEIIRGQRVCLVGPNGAGKSTLLKMLAGVLDPTKGSVKYGHNVDKGYFSQSRLDVLNPDRNAFDEVCSAMMGGSVPSLQVRSLLGLFNFHGDDVFKLVKVLSGGEKNRLILAKLLINPPNFMLLDEPTTHLDVDGIKALTTAFKAYEGTMCFISHDLFFIREVADCVVDVHDGRLKIYPGGLQYYLDKKEQSDQLSFEKKQKELKDKKARNKKASGKNKKGEKPVLSSIQEQHKNAKKRLSQIKTEIKKLKEETKALDTESYVKARKMSELYASNDGALIKEYGQRLKAIQTRQREIGTQIKELESERDRINN